jgi:4-hydroxy-tetrahydrodipicolinate synthase
MTPLDKPGWKSRLRGALLPAVPIPFDDTGRIACDAQAAYIDYMNAQPAAGVAVWVHSGRGIFLDRRQRIDVMTVWRKGLSGDRLLIAGAGGLSPTGDPSPAADKAYVDHAVQMARDAADHGAAALLVYAPRRFRARADQDDRILEYHNAVADVGLPVILFYLYEAAGGINYSLDLLRRLLAIPNTIGIKMATLDSVMTYQDVSRLIETHFPDVTLITGEDRFLGYSIMRGATAALIGMGAACTAMQKQLLDAWLESRPGDFLRLSACVDAFAEATFIQPMEGYIRRMLWALHLLGVIDRNATHDPWGPEVPASQFDALAETMRRIGEL